MKIVFTGGSHAGKSTLTKHFEDAGYSTVKEAGMQIVKELSEKMGVEEYSEWRINNAVLFWELIAKRQIELDTKLQDDETVFFDRTIIDVVAVLRFHDQIAPSFVNEYARTHKYDKIFLCDTLSSFDGRKSTGRLYMHDDSVKIGAHCKDVYEEYGYKVHVLKDKPLEERIEEVEKVLNI